MISTPSLFIVRFVRLFATLASVMLAASACTAGTEADAAALVSRDDVIAAYVEAGMIDSVASCVVGLGEREFELNELMPSATPATLVQEIVDNCRAANDLINGGDAPPSLAFDDPAVPFEYGEDAALDLLWDGCEAGDGAACDELWESAPVDSRYEEFGVTCGNRPEILDCALELIPEG